jgi:molybdopterin-guanine dinucleotide biosynthesis protein A
MESAVILAGGKSLRMGRNKALLELGGETLIRRLYSSLDTAFDEVLISANDPETYDFLDAAFVPDIYEAGGCLAGLHAGLLSARGESCFFAACDMPFVNIDLVRYLGSFSAEYDLVVPVSRSGLEPLHAFYSRSCLPHIERQLDEGNLKIIDFFDKVRVREVTVDEMSEYDPHELSHFNINTQADYDFALKSAESAQT